MSSRKKSSSKSSKSQKTSWFTHFAKKVATLSGRPATFAIAVGAVLLWAVTGPVFGFSDTWQLVINTSTTIITFLMVSLIQNTQNRDSEAIQIKLDELIRALHATSNSVLDLEELDDAELAKIRKHYLALAEKARRGK
jgi:low affinity Fe/Cu permease